MKSSLMKLLVVVVCVGFGLSTFTVRAEDKPKKKAPAKEAPAAEPAAKPDNAAKKEEADKKPPITVTGTAKAVPNKTDETKKHLELTDKEGLTYILVSKKITAEEVAKYDGKKVTCTGSKYQKEGSAKATLFASEIEEAK